MASKGVHNCVVSTRRAPELPRDPFEERLERFVGTPSLQAVTSDEATSKASKPTRHKLGEPVKKPAVTFGRREAQPSGERRDGDNPDYHVSVGKAFLGKCQL